MGNFNVIGRDRIPGHLPDRLAIGMWGFYWLTYVSEGEGYADLERAVVEAKARNFNCLRVDVAPDWCYDLSSRRRGPIELGPWVPGASRNNRCFSYKGHVRYDVYDRVMRLFELAKRYDLCLILTTWQFQETPPIPVDPSIRNDILSFPREQWFGHLAEVYDRLLTDVRDRGWIDRVAFVEVHNEINWSPGTDAEKRERTEAAIAFLKSRHSDVLVCGDYAWLEEPILPGNTDLIDHHVYASKTALGRFFCRGDWPIERGPNLDDEFLKWVLRPNPEPWPNFLARANVNAFLHPAWLCRTWLYSNLDNYRFDYWCFREFGREVDEVVAGVEEKIRHGARLARDRGVPVVVDEGYNLYPPLRSRFEESAAGRWICEQAVHAAIAEGYWGILPTGYFTPDEPAWTEEPQRTYLMELNEHILKGKVDRLLGPDRER